MSLQAIYRQNTNHLPTRKHTALVVNNQLTDLVSDYVPGHCFVCTFSGTKCRWAKAVATLVTPLTVFIKHDAIQNNAVNDNNTKFHFSYSEINALLFFPVTGLNVWVSVFSVGCVCIFYTSLVSVALCMQRHPQPHTHTHTRSPRTSKQGTICSFIPSDVV